MSDGVDSLGFTYTLDVAKATGPAADLARALGLVNKGLESVTRAFAKFEGAASGGAGVGRLAKATEHAASASAHWEKASKLSFDAQTDGWSKSQAAAEKANHALGKMQSAAISMDERRTAAMEREVAKREAASDRAMQREIRNAGRISAAREKVTNRAAEKASHKYYFGGEKSFSGLIQKQHESQVSGLATSLAGNLTPIGMAGNVVGAAGSAFGLVTDVVSAGASLAYQFGKMAISAQAMREESVEGFNAIFKSTTAGDKLFDAARVAAKQTKFDTPEVVKRFNTLAGRGFGENEVEKTFWSVADVETGRGYMTANRYENALSKLKVSPKATFATFQQGAMASGGTELAEQKLAELLGIKKTKNLDDTLRQRFKDGKIGGEVALQALIAGTNARYNGGGEAGKFAKEQGDKTWSGVLSNIANGLGDILNMKLPEDHAINKFKKILLDIGSKGGLFDATSDMGGKFQTLISKFVDDIFMPFGGKDINTGSIMAKVLSAGTQIEAKFNSLMKEISKGFNQIISDVEEPLTGMVVRIAIKVSAALAHAAGKELGSLWSQTGGQLSNSLYQLIAPDSQKEGGSSVPLVDSSMPAGGSHASGGEIPGPYGMPVLTLMHGGEIVPGLHGERMADAQRAYGVGGGGGNTYNIYVTAGSGAEDIANEVVRCIEMAVRSPSASSTPG